MLIIDHMSRYPSGDAERSVDDVLRDLLAGVLEPAYRKRDPRDVATAATLLDEARSAIADELILVEPNSPSIEPEENGCGDRPSGTSQQRRRRG